MAARSTGVAAITFIRQDLLKQLIIELNTHQF
jgi:hypothetical protein